MWELKDQTGRD